MLTNAPAAVPLLAAQRRQLAQADQLTTSSDLNSSQTALEVGQSIPIVFGKRTGGAGGVWLSPAAAECRFDNDTANRVTASYQLVLSDGQLATIPEGDIYQGDTPLIAGQYLQNYNARAGTWAPGNFIQQRFNVTVSVTEQTVEGKQIGEPVGLDISLMTAEELEEHLNDAFASVTIKSSGNYITHFRIDVTKTVNWNRTGDIAYSKGNTIAPTTTGWSVGAGSGGTSGISIVVTPDLSYFDSSPWFGPYVSPYAVSKDEGVVIRFVSNGYGVYAMVDNGYVYERTEAGRFLNTKQYEVTKTASLEPYGNLEINLVEQVRGGFLLRQTAYLSNPYIQNQSIGLFGGLAPVFYKLTITEENSEPLPKPEATIYCGTGGSYSGVTTLSVTRQYPAEDEGWRRQVHAFIRNGRPMARLVEGTEGPSNLFPDLARFALLSSGQLDSSLIDTAAMLASAQFNRVNDFTCDGVAAVPANVPEWIDRLAPLFLLRPTNAWGKIGLRPAVPVTAGNLINTSTLTPVMVFDESNMLSGLRIEGIPAEERNWRVGILPLWREQPETDLGMTRGTGPVRYQDVPDSSPVEEVDGSEWLTRELHAVRMASLELARRRHIEHRGSFDVDPSPAIAALKPGDIIRVNRARIPTVGNPSDWSYLYEIIELGGPPLGPWTISIEHHPVDVLGASLIAREVAGAILS